MFCQDARRLLDQGVIPGSSDQQRILLGFHLSGCADCRAHRKKIDNLRILRTLLAQQLCAPHVAAARRPRNVAAQPLRMAGAALLIGGALGVVPCIGILPARATPTSTDSALPMTVGDRREDVPRGTWLLTPRTTERDDAPWTAPRAAPRARQSADADLLHDLLGIPATPAEARADIARKTRFARTELAPGQALVIPVSPETSVADIAGEAEPAPQAQTQGSYVVQSGDSLWAIAQRFYGNGALWPTIYRANAGVIGGNPNLIFPDQRFTIPQTPATPVTLPAQPPQSGQGPGRYTIVRGDTLSDIAFRVYGNANRWPDIYARNQRVIGNNPHLIYPGTVLDLPPR